MTRKQQACEQFVRRRRYAQQIEKIDNSDLHAGSPMYFYCRHCGIPTEVLPEDFVFQPTLTQAILMATSSQPTCAML